MKRKLKIIGQILILVSLVIISFLGVYHYYQSQKDEELVNDYIEETKIVDDVETNEEQPEIKKEYQQEINYTAVLEIPSIDLKRGVVDSTKNFSSINYAISVDKHSNYPDKEGNFILYAHSGNSNISYFKKLINVNIGDGVYVYYKGVKYNYKITNKYDIEKTGKADVLLSNNDKYITLITCNPNKKGYQVILIGKLFEQSNY